MKDSLRAGAEQICEQLRDAGHRALLAGGCVRDMVLGIAPQDYDIATSARPNEIVRLFPKTVPVGVQFGVVVVVMKQGEYEVATFRKDGPYLDGRHPSYVEFEDEKEDAARRDFTINALFYDPSNDEIVDYVGGHTDIRRGVIRTVGDPRRRFEEDYLRMLRAVRFAARFGYAIEQRTMRAIKEMAAAITKTSAERIRDELIKILTEGGADRGFYLLTETGLLQEVLPEIAQLQGVEQPPRFHPEGDVFTHTMLMLGHMKEPSPTLALSVLLHDVGKPLTQTFEDRIRFNNHDKVGARVAEQICERLHMSNKDKRRVSWLVEQHMRLAKVQDMRESKRKRFVREEGFDELLELCRLDCLGSHRKIDHIEWIKDYKSSLKPEETAPEPLIGGDDLIEMGYQPGPAFSEMLQAVEDAQLEGSISTPEDAKAFVREHWPEPTRVRQ